jgi:plastocyanin
VPRGRAASGDRPARREYPVAVLRLLPLLLAVAFVPVGTALAATPKPKPVTVYVTEYEFGFKLSRQTVHPGRVTFVMRNNGTIIHNFDLIVGGSAKVGPFLVPGQSARMTVSLKRGEYTYVCSVKYHAAQGMQGTFTVR